MKDIQLSKHLTSSSALTLSHSNKLDDLRLTEHFKLSEFTKSSTASARGIDNTPNEQQVANLKRLCQEVLEPLRQHFGVPIIIGSGFRCPKLNKLVGGVSNSQHMTGEACDIHLSDQKKLRDWFTWLMDNTNFDQLILERFSKTSPHYWIHVSCKSGPSKNRHQVKFITKA